MLNFISPRGEKGKKSIHLYSREENGKNLAFLGILISHFCTSTSCSSSSTLWYFSAAGCNLELYPKKLLRVSKSKRSLFWKPLLQSPPSLFHLVFLGLDTRQSSFGTKFLNSSAPHHTQKKNKTRSTQQVKLNKSEQNALCVFPCFPLLVLCALATLLKV